MPPARRGLPVLCRAMKQTLLILFFAFLNVPAFASNWVDVGGNANVHLQLDRDSIRRIGPKVKVWTTWKFTAPQTNAGTGNVYQMARDLDVYNCDEGTTAMLQQIQYAPDGITVTDNLVQQEARGKYQDVAPDTFGESIMKLVCATKLK